MTLALVNSNVEVFSDAGSWPHVGLGLLAGFLGPTWGLALATGFVGYQLSQAPTVSWPRTGGEVIEFALGAALGALLKGGR